jgi:RNA polymerase sigma-70 factor (ECF subfamily)
MGMKDAIPDTAMPGCATPHEEVPYHAGDAAGSNRAGDRAKRAANDDLVHRALVCNDAAAFDELFRSKQSYARTAIYSRLSPNYTGYVDDVLQETWLRVWTRRGQLRSGCAFDVWLYRTATNAACDFLRNAGVTSTRKRVSVALEDVAGEMATGYDVQRQELLRKEVTAALARGLVRLPFKQRQSIILKNVYGYKEGEEQVATGQFLGTLKGRRSRAAKRLCDHLLRSPTLAAFYGQDERPQVNANCFVEKIFEVALSGRGLGDDALSAMLSAYDRRPYAAAKERSYAKDEPAVALK